MTTRWTRAGWTVFFVAAMAGTCFGRDGSMECRDGSDGGRRSCEIREQTLDAGSHINVDASPNGGISIRAWDQSRMLVRAKVEAWNGERSSDAMLRQISLRLSPDSIRADGPRQEGREGWSVSFEVFVPRSKDLTLRTVNGGISVDAVRGALRFETVNGGVHLSGVGGRIEGHTVNGGVTVQLAGNSFQGERMEVSTTNGGVHLQVPDGYSARLEIETVHGGVHGSLPNAYRSSGWIGNRMEATLGKGGPLIHLSTTNGGVHVDRI